MTLEDMTMKESFQEFAEKNDTGTPCNMICPAPYNHRLQRKNTADYLFLYPNEQDAINFGNTLKEKKIKGEKYVGIIGGVFTNFEYISALKSKEALLIDINPLAIQHLAFCLYHSNDLHYSQPKNNLQQFIANINSPINEKKSENLFGRDSSGKLVDFSLYSEKTINIMTEGIKNYYENLENESNWLKNPEHIKQLLENNKIKVFRDEFISGSKKLFEYINSGNSKENLVLYLSNAFPFDEELKKISKDYKTNLKNTIKKQTIIYATPTKTELFKKPSLLKKIKKPNFLKKQLAI